MPLTSFEGRVAVITGAASGIGRALAVAISGEGARVVLADIDEETRIRESERNRPAALRNEREESRPPVELIGRTLPADTVAEMVLAAIRDNRLYVITHEEALEPLRRRFQRLEQAIRERKS
jgi:NAD(P)-dependent dehydrogenase (short-subunit alcohol dehydrogenase family)